MIWEDVMVNKILTEREIKAGIAAAMTISPSRILVVNEIPSDKLASDYWVMCHKIIRSGNFPMQLSIYTREPSLDSIDVAKAMEAFCVETHSNVLISDQAANPYTRLFINSIKERRKAELDPNRLDEHEEFVIRNLI